MIYGHLICLQILFMKSGQKTKISRRNKDLDVWFLRRSLKQYKILCSSIFFFNLREKKDTGHKKEVVNNF